MTPRITVPNRSEHETGGFFSGVPRLLKILALIAVLCWLVLFLATAVGCSAARQADTHAKVAAVSDAAADRIDTGLAALPDDPAAGPVNPDAIRPLLPADWHAAFDRLVASGRSAVEAAAEVAVELRTIAVENRAAEDAIRAEIAAGGDRWVLAATQVGAAAQGINPAVGLAVTVIGALGGLVAGNRRGKAEGARQVAEIVNAGLHVDLSAREAVKSGVAGDAMKTQLGKSSPIVQRVVNATKL
jgi:hypothetical protein